MIMRPTLDRTRRSAVVWVAAPLMALAAAGAVASPASWDFSFGGASGHIESLCAVIAPAIAGLVAWEASRGRRSGFYELEASTARSALLVGARVIGVGAALGIVVYVAAAVLVALGFSLYGSPQLAVIALGALVIIAWAALGYAIGLWVPHPATAPIVALASYLFLVVDSSHSLAWTSLLAGVDQGCCGLNVAPRTGALAGQALVLTGLIGVGLLLIAGRRWQSRARRPGGGLTLRSVGAIGLVAALIAGGVGELRTGNGALLVSSPPPSHYPCARAEGLTVCVWPAERPQLGLATRAAALAFAPLQGLPDVPHRLYAQGLLPPQRAERTGTFSLPLGRVSAQSLAVSMVGGLAGAVPSCAKRLPGGGASWPGAQVLAELQGWLIHQVEPDTTVQALVPPPVQPELSSLLQAPSARQRAWAAQALRAQHDCSLPAPPIP